MTDLGKGGGQTFKIVSPNDANPKEGLLSATSPVAQALIGHAVRGRDEIKIPVGVRKLRIEQSLERSPSRRMPTAATTDSEGKSDADQRGCRRRLGWRIRARVRPRHGDWLPRAPW